MFGAMWSEHCGYKNSKPLLRLFPSTGPHVLTTRGGENAGAVDIGGGGCAVFKIESHNHPSAVEPYQGAATGVGGIVRDIFAMGARPIAILDSLRFGPLSERHNRYLFGGIGGANVLASRVFDEDSAELRPTVQVGNPFLEKLLMEACVDLAENHPDWFVGIQDLGAAGLTSSAIEAAARAGTGVDIDISRVPRR